MPIDFYKTHTLLAAIEQVPTIHTFLRDRYFPTNETTDVFSTDDVLIEYREGSKKLAPFVAPRKGGITITRNGSYMERYEPPFIAPRRAMTIDDLKKRGFGEALMTQLTPDMREAAMLLKDADELTQLIIRREEAMAAETLINNGCVMKHYADDLGTVAEEKEIRFYDGSSNPAWYTPAIDWSDPENNMISDMAIMIRMLTERGLAATELLVAPDVADNILADEKLQKLLDLKNYNVGGVDPSLLPEGVAKVARLNIKGRMIDILCYEDTYESDDGKITQFIPAGHAVMTAPGVGRTLYGAVTQLEQSDGQFHTYTGRRVPKYLSDPNNNTRTLTVTSCPLMIPNQKTSWITAKVQ